MPGEMSAIFISHDNFIIMLHNIISKFILVLLGKFNTTIRVHVEKQLDQLKEFYIIDRIPSMFNFLILLMRISMHLLRSTVLAVD